MNKTLVLSDTQSKILLDFYLDKIKEIDEIVAPYMTQKLEYAGLVNQLQGAKMVTHVKSDNPTNPGNLFGGSQSEYDFTWSVPKKGLFILSKEQKDLSTTEIFEALLSYEPNLKEKRRHLMVLISSGFADKVGKTLYRTGKSRSDYKYGLLEWKKEKVTTYDNL